MYNATCPFLLFIEWTRWRCQWKYMIHQKRNVKNAYVDIISVTLGIINVPTTTCAVYGDWLECKQQQQQKQQQTVKPKKIVFKEERASPGVLMSNLCQVTSNRPPYVSPFFWCDCRRRRRRPCSLLRNVFFCCNYYLFFFLGTLYIWVVAVCVCNLLVALRVPETWKKERKMVPSLSLSYLQQHGKVR